MEYFGARVVSKAVGQNYEIEWDKEKFSVTIIFKGKRKQTYTFGKFYKAVNFYARLKKVKDVKEADFIYKEML